MKRVGLLGISCVDILVNGADKIPKPGTLGLIEKVQMNTGGCALNAALDYKKMGFDPLLITVVGQDSFGEFILNVLGKHHISTDYVQTLHGMNTSASIVLINKAGERSFLHNPGANKQFRIDDLDLSFLDQIDILFIAGTLVMNTFEENDLANLLSICKERGIYTVLDTVYDASGRWGKVILPLLPNVDLFAPSLEEAEQIAQSKDLNQIALTFKKSGAKDVIIKLGKQGAFSNISNVTHFHKPFIVESVDTTGAGDAFMSGILVGLSQLWPMNETIDFANAVGALSVSKIGASSGIQSYREIKEFMKR